MTQKQSYWLADENGHLVSADGAEQRDELAAAGWTRVDEPYAGDQVWMQHDTTKAFARFGVGSLEVWQARGWQLAVPPVEQTDTGMAVSLPATSAPSVVSAAVPAAVTAPTETAAAEQPSSPKHSTEKGR